MSLKNGLRHGKSPVLCLNDPVVLRTIFQEKSGTNRKKVCRTATKFLHSAGGVINECEGSQELHTATNFLMLYGFEIKKIVEIV
ncbi:hypothetical protein ACNKHM_11680 [Shigella sonnei]